MKTETAFFGGGCFWCTEAIFKSLQGVKSVMPGYAGGTRKNPSYEDVCTGETGHAEVSKIEFDPSVISYKELLDILWNIHDPTSLNRQGNDIGTQYRSIILYTSEKQKKDIEDAIADLKRRHVFDLPLVTEVKPFEVFYEAENYHKNYFAMHPDKPYCRLVISPKLQHFKEQYAAQLKHSTSEQ